MKNRAFFLVISVSLLVLVLLAILTPRLMISPGEPIEAHRDISEGCFACHAPFIGSTPEKCIACHEVSEIGLRTTKGIIIAREDKNVAFHQSLTEEDCVACHSEHRGVRPFRPISQFSHELLEGDIQNQCDSCHKNPSDAFHRKTAGNCNTCHTQESWQPATFEHDEFFRFDQHHDTDCTTCHTGNNYDSYTCYGCHEHSRSNTREEHFEEGIYEYENCIECHRSGNEDEAEQLWQSRRFESNKEAPHNYRYGLHDDDHSGHGDDD